MTKFRTRNSASAKLTPVKVVEIRERYAAGGITQGALAREYQLSVVQIGRIIRQEVWQALPPMPASEADLLASAKRMLELQESTSEQMSKAIAEAKEKDKAGDRMLEELTGDQDARPRNPLDE